MISLLHLALLCSLLLVLIHQAISATSNLPLVGTTCNPNNTRLLVDNNQLKSDCGYVAWCDTSDDTCKVRGCRRDEYPFGFNQIDRDLWPPFCRSGQFCPDEGSACMDTVGLGQPCQLSRDDQCIQNASPAGVKCLHQICVAVDATLASKCIYENTIYTDFTDRENNYGDIISRDNCMSGLYCDSPTTQCLAQLTKGTSCSADKECQSGYCYDSSFLATVPVNNNYTGTCGDDPSAAKSKIYVYVILAVAIVLLSTALGVCLVRIHLRQTKEKKAAREEYWTSQKEISGKAKMIDEVIRSNTPQLSKHFQQNSNLRTSSQSTATISSTTPLRRVQYQQKYGERTPRTGSTSNLLQRSVSPNYIHSSLQQQHQDNGSSIDNEFSPLPENTSHLPMDEVFATPSQSTTSLLLEPYTGNNGVSANSSALDPFANPSEYVRNRETRNRPTNGWQSPDVNLSPSV